jgi:regulator of sigma E protease
MGLKDGDRIISAGEYKCDEFNPGQIRRHIVIYNAQSLKINRGGQDMEIPVSPEYIDQLTSKEVEFVSIRFPFVIDSVAPGKAAAQAGLMKGDSLVAFNHDTVGFYHQFVNYFKANKGKEATLSVVRKGQPMDIKITPDQDGVIGVFNKTPANYLKAETETFGLNAFPRGVGLAISTLSDQLNAFGQMFKGKIKATKAMGGFASMASNFSPYWDWHRFWLLTATISIILAFMNLLPIPALDGGHVVFTLWEMITGRKPGDKFMEYAQVVGFVIVLALLLFANGMDIYRWFHK